MRCLFQDKEQVQFYALAPNNKSMQENKETPKRPKTEKNPQGAGRKEWIFDEEKAKKFVQLCTADCNIEELCAYFDVSFKTLKKQISAYYTKIKGEKTEFSNVFEQKKRLYNVNLKLATVAEIQRGNSAIIIHQRKIRFNENERLNLAHSVDFEVDYSKSSAPDFTKD